MTRAGWLCLVGLFACGGSTPAPVHAPTAAPAPASDPALEHWMTNVIASAGVEARHFRLECMANACKATCQTSPIEACVEQLQRVTQWAAHQHPLFASIQHNARQGWTRYTFVSKDELAAWPARRELVERIARRFVDSPALFLCRKHATASGTFLLYIDVPIDGTASVKVGGGGEIEQSSDADCISKALLATVIDEHVAPPFANRDYPIAVKLE